MSSSTSTTTAASAAANNNNDDLMGNLRLDQLLEEGDHKRCSEGNKEALLTETLGQLRSLTKELQQDDWMFAPQSSAAAAAAGNNTRQHP